MQHNGLRSRALNPADEPSAMRQLTALIFASPSCGAAAGARAAPDAGRHRGREAQGSDLPAAGQWPVPGGRRAAQLRRPRRGGIGHLAPLSPTGASGWWRAGYRGAVPRQFRGARAWRPMQRRPAQPALRPRAGRRCRSAARHLLQAQSLCGGGSRLADRLGQWRRRGALDRAPRAQRARTASPISARRSRSIRAAAGCATPPGAHACRP